jgi:hypothetical protein
MRWDAATITFYYSVVLRRLLGSRKSDPVLAKFREHVRDGQGGKETEGATCRNERPPRTCDRPHSHSSAAPRSSSSVPSSKAMRRKGFRRALIVWFACSRAAFLAKKPQPARRDELNPARCRGCKGGSVISITH